MEKKVRSQLLSILGQLYPNPASELVFHNEYQLIVSVVLSAQCTDKKVNEVTPVLFKKFSDFKALSRAKIEEVEAIIRPINYYKTKSRNLVALGEMVEREFGGAIPREFTAITSLPGVGRKTANVVLGELGVDFTIPVDTHVFRVSKRLGLSSGKDPLEVEVDLQKSFAKEDWRSLHHWLIFHGRRVCIARSPKCEECAIRPLCPSVKTTHTSLRSKKTKSSGR